jgi:acyl dehydratase
MADQHRVLVTLARGALTGFGKRPSAASALPPTRLTASAVRVDPARVASYAALCGYRSAGPELPLTYPHILGFPLTARLMAARAFPLPLAGLVHTSITLTRHAPLLLGDRPDLAVHAECLRAHHRGTEVVMVTEARLGGRLVWEDRSTYLCRRGGPGAGSSGSPEGHPGGRPGRRSVGEPDPLPVLPAVAEWHLPAGLGRHHARVSGDWNPIHLHPLTARPLGFPRAIAHGMWTVARCAAANPDAGHLSAEFRQPILLPATVTYGTDGARFEVRTGTRLHLRGTAAGPAHHPCGQGRNP